MAEDGQGWQGREADRWLGGVRGAALRQETDLRLATQTGTFSVTWPLSALRDRATWP